MKIVLYLLFYVLVVVSGAGLMDFFTTIFTGPDGLFIQSYNTLDYMPVNSIEDCAQLCLKYDECISFSYAPNFAINGYAAMCIVDGASDRFQYLSGGGGGYHIRLRNRDDRPYFPVMSYNLSIFDHGITVKSGMFRDVIDGEYYYLMNNYNIDDLLYWYRIRAGVQKPPGKSHGWDSGLQGSISGLFMMGAGGILRWEERKDLRLILNELINGIAQYQMSDGYFGAFPQDEVILRENPNYVTAWQTHGLIAAHKAGNSQALQLLRDHLNWFNNNSYIPLFLPPNGGAETWDPNYTPLPPGYPNVTGNPDAAWSPYCTPFCVNHHYIYLQYQGMIKHTQMALTGMGTYEDLNIVQKLYQEDWWLRQLIAQNESAIWLRHWYPHNYELTAFEAYLDMYTLTGNTTYLNAVLGGWTMFKNSWIHVGGSIALNEQAYYPPKSYYIGENNSPTGELCGSSFWIKVNQRLHMIYPFVEVYVYEIERSLYNVIAAAQGLLDDNNTTPNRGGGIRYFANLQPYKWGPYTIGTCCEGQAGRIIGSLPEFIYTMAPDGIFIDLFIASILSTTYAGYPLEIEQLTKFPDVDLVQIIVIQAPPIDVSLYIRMPNWASKEGVVILLNGGYWGVGKPGNYIKITASWNTNDQISFQLSPTLKSTLYIGANQIMVNSTNEVLPQYAFEYGPILLVAMGPWNNTLITPNTTVKGGIYISGVDPSLPENWLIRDDPLPTYSMSFSVLKNPQIYFVPYWEIQLEVFTVFPVVSR